MSLISVLDAELRALSGEARGSGAGGIAGGLAASLLTQMNFIQGHHPKARARSRQRVQAMFAQYFLAH